MTTPRNIADTLYNIVDHPLIRRIRDKSFLVPDEDIQAVLDFWNYDLYSKRPGIAYTSDGIKHTTLDLATFMYALTDRNAVINLPEYKSKRPTNKFKNQVVLSRSNRHGQCLGLTSNQEVFTFGVRIKDANVMVSKQDEQTIGAYRTFLLTNFDGELYDGWRKIDFVPTAKENDFIKKNNLFEGHSIIFDRFVNPERWISFYGQYYFIAKALLGRIVEERQFCKKQIESMRKKGIRLPPHQREEFEEMDWDKKTTGAYKTVKVWSFESEIDLPLNSTDYAKFPATSSNLLGMYKRVKMLTKAIERLRFLTRSVEYAFASKHTPDMGIEEANADSFLYPAWIDSGSGWESGFKFPRCRSEWFRLKFKQHRIGEFSVALRFRWVKKSQKVNLEVH